MSNYFIKIWVVVSLILAFNSTFCQVTEKPLVNFNKIEVGPKINLTLQQGEIESALIPEVYVDLSELVFEVKNHALYIYLKGAKNKIKNELIINKGRIYRSEKYKYLSVDVTVNYKSLSKLIVKGNNNIVCNGEINGNNALIAVHNNSKVEIEKVVSNFLNIKLCNCSSLKINQGEINNQNCNFTGNNTLVINSKSNAKTTSFLYPDFYNSFITTPCVYTLKP